MQNLRGIALVVFAMAVFSVEDALIKTMSADLPIGQILCLIGLGGMAVFFTAAGDAGRVWIVRSLRVPQVLWRSAAEGVAALSFVTALSLIPLSTVAAVFQATPLAVTAGAAVFLGEEVGWRRWTAVVVGFLGVLLIIRPGLDGFRPEAALVLITVFAIALRDLVTRRVPGHVPSVAVAFHGFTALFIGGGALILIGQEPVLLAPRTGLILAVTILCGTSGYYAIVASMRLADASALMPFRYSRLIFSLMIGVAFFSERPDSLTLTGAGLILGAAFYAYLRERKVALTAKPA